MRTLKLVRALMFFAAFAAAVAAGGAAQAAVKTQVIDVTGITAQGAYGDPANTIIELDLGALAQVTSISWDFTITAYPPSWLYDLEIHFSTSAGFDGVVFTPSFTFDSGSEHHTGSAILDDLGLAFNVGADGKLLIEFADYFKDFPAGQAEGAWNSGSISIGYITSAVPEPATYAMLMLGLIVVGAMARRRRNG
jgi:hypothetical protein